MKLRTVAASLFYVLAAAALHAQSGVYLTFNAQQFTQEGIFANPYNHGNIDRPWLYGPGYGIYYDIARLPYLGKLRTGPVRVGLDGRGETLRLSEYGSTLNKQDGYLSVRVSLKTPLWGATPYAQGGFGIGHTRVPFAQTYSNNLAYQFGVGVDKPIHHHLDWRVEATTGFLGNYRPGTAATGSNYMITLDTGLVYRLK